MASKNPNLKVNVGADTSNFTKGMSQARKELKAFESAGSEAFSSIAGALGLNIPQLQRLNDIFKGASRSLSEMGNTGTKALGNIATAAKGVAGVIGGIGIAAATIAFKQLNAEAEAFKSTVEGANIELQTQAYLSTYRQFMHDVNAEQGKAMAEAQSSWQKFWGTLGGRLPTLIGGATGTATGAAISGDLYRVQNEMKQQAKEVFDQAIDAGEKAEAITGEIYRLERQRKEQTVELAKINADIADAMQTARDSANSAAERNAAIARAEELIAQKKALSVNLEEQLATLYKQRSDLAGDSIQDADETLAQQARVFDAQRAITQEETSLLRIKKQVAAAGAEEAKAARETAAAIALGVSRMQELAQAQIELFVSDESRQALQGFATKPIEVPVRLETEEAEQQILDLSETIQSTIVEAISGMAASIGELLGNAINGEGGMAEFGQDVLTMIGTFAEKFGKVLVAYGAAVLAFESAFENPYAAIAAGAGLIVLGAMVKQIASNMSSSIGSGASSQSSYVASSGSYGAGGYSNSTLQVEVTGTLTANGSQLVAVLNNENNRTNYTT